MKFNSLAMHENEFSNLGLASTESFM